VRLDHFMPSVLKNCIAPSFDMVAKATTPLAFGT
jgi:hypothetical protein